MSASGQPLIDRFRRARRSPAAAVLEGLHPLKHALRFGARIEEAVATDPDRILELAAELAPDTLDRLRSLLRVVPEELFLELAPTPPPSGVMAIAQRPLTDAREMLARDDDAPVVLLDRPTHLGNIGAVVRVAAAAGAAAVLCTGRHDPWHPAALRGSAGLHFAIPVAHVDSIATGRRAHLPVLGVQTAGSQVELPDDRPLIAVHPEGEPLGGRAIPRRAVLAFGSERRGLGVELLRDAVRTIAIPMRAGVSSLNLATAVAVVLYVERGGASRG